MLSWPMKSTNEQLPGRYRLVALDLDSTLQPDGALHPADIAALRTAHGAGIKITLASARPPEAMHRYWAQLGLGTPVIALNGALVYDFPSHKHIFAQAIPAEQVRDLLQIVQRQAPKATVGLESGESWAVNRLSPVANWHIQQTGVWPTTVGNLKKALQEPVYQLWVEAEAPVLQALETQMAAGGLALMRYTEPQMLMVRSASASRGWALSALAGYLEIPPHEVMAIGDGGLDRSMLQVAAFSVVTSGVESPSLLAELPAVPGAVSSGGIAEVFERYLAAE